MNKLMLVASSMLLVVTVGCTGNQTAEEKVAAKPAAVKAKPAPKCVKESKAIEAADKARKKANSVNQILGGRGRWNSLLWEVMR